MRTSRTRKSEATATGRLLALASLLWGVLWGAAVFAAPLDLDSSGVAWRGLEFRSPDRPDDINVVVTLSDAAADERAALPGPTPGGEWPKGGSPAAAALQRMTSIVEISATGRAYRTDVWFAPDGLVPLERRRDKTGKGANRKVFHYLADGVRRLRIEPDGRSEAKRPPEEWSLVQELFFPYGPARAGCQALLDPNLLFVVATAELAGPEPRDLCVFNKQTIHRVRLSAVPGEALAVDYQVTDAAGRREVRRQAQIRRVRIQTFLPDPDGRDADPFEFFEMRGEIEIDLDVETRLPLRVAGDVGGIGRVEFHLHAATLRP